MIEKSHTKKPSILDELTSVLGQRNLVYLLEGVAFVFQMQNVGMAIAVQTRLDASTWHCQFISRKGQDFGLASLE